MKNKLFMIFVLLGAALSFLCGGENGTGKIVELRELAKPSKIRVSGDELFVVDNRYRIIVYSLQDFKLKRQFGRRGEGPGEFKRSIDLSVRPDFILVDSQDRISWFSKEGKFLEHKNKRTASRFMPFKDKFIVQSTRFLSAQKSEHEYRIHDSELKIIKTLYKYTLEMPLLGPNIVVKEWKMIHHYRDIIPDPTSGKIFITDSEKGFFIKVSDEKGDEVYTIVKDNEIEKIKIPDEYKNKKVKEFKQGGFWRQELKPHNTKLTFPEYFPPFSWVRVNNGKIYAQTYKMKDNKTRFIVLDLKGKILKEVYLPVQNEQGHRRQTVHNNTFYKLIEDLEKESWELHIYEM